MRRRSLNTVLAVGLVFSAFLIWNLEPDPTQPIVQFIPEMHYSIPYGPQAANPLTPDGKTLQLPPAGTIARGYLPLHYTSDDAGRVRAAQELRSPVDEDSAEAQERGSIVYLRYCQPCHGPTGEGNGVVTRFGFPPPPSFASPAVVALRDGALFHTITYGKGNMPSLASQVRPEDRWNVILKVRALQQMLQRTQAGVTGGRTGQQ